MRPDLVSIAGSCIELCVGLGLVNLGLALAELGSNFVNLGPRLVDFGQIRRDTGRHQRRLCQHRPDFGRRRLIFSESLQLCRHRRNLKFVELCPPSYLPEHSPNLALDGPNSRHLAASQPHDSPEKCLHRGTTGRRPEPGSDIPPPWCRGRVNLMDSTCSSAQSTDAASASEFSPFGGQVGIGCVWAPAGLSFPAFSPEGCRLEYRQRLVIQGARRRRAWSRRP